MKLDHAGWLGLTPIQDSCQHWKAVCDRLQKQLAQAGIRVRGNMSACCYCPFPTTPASC